MCFLVNILNMGYTRKKKKKTTLRIWNFSSYNPLNRLIQIYFPPEVRSAKLLKNKNISIFYQKSTDKSHKFLKAFQQNEPRSLGKLLAYDLGKRGFSFCGKLHCQQSSVLKITFRVKTSSDCCQRVPLPACLHVCTKGPSVAATLSRQSGHREDWMLRPNIPVYRCHSS